MPAGNLWASLADSTRTHRLILIAFWCISTCTRSGMGLAVCGSFGAQLALSLITEVSCVPGLAWLLWPHPPLATACDQRGKPLTEYSWHIF